MEWQNKFILISWPNENTCYLCTKRFRFPILSIYLHIFTKKKLKRDTDCILKIFSSKFDAWKTRMTRSLSGYELQYDITWNNIINRLQPYNNRSLFHRESQFRHLCIIFSPEFSPFKPNNTTIRGEAATSCESIFHYVNI